MKIVLFDIDGTLVNSRGAGRAALEMALADEFGIDTPAEVALQGRTDRGIARDLFRAHNIEESPENWDRFRQSYLSHLPRNLPLRQGQVLSGAAELVAHLAADEGFALGLLTGNVRDGARIKLEFFELFHYFAFGGFGDHHFDRNDVAREAWDAGRQHAGDHISPEAVVVIGDTLLDIACARSIGARCVAVATGGHTREELLPGEADLLLDDLADPSIVIDFLN